MCGIAGVVAWDERYRVDRRTYRRAWAMSSLIAGRMDKTSGWDEQCSLAFARLAILDLDPRAMQPMTDGETLARF